MLAFFATMSRFKNDKLTAKLTNIGVMPFGKLGKLTKLPVERLKPLVQRALDEGKIRQVGQADYPRHVQFTGLAYALANRPASGASPAVITSLTQ